MAILHDQRMTAVHASVSPIWDSPLRLCDRAAWDKLESHGSEEESGRIWWMFDRAVDGSPRHLSEPILDDNFAEMTFDRGRGVWVAEIELTPGARRIDFFTNHRKTVYYQEKAYVTYLSCPFTRVILSR